MKKLIVFLLALVIFGCSEEPVKPEPKYFDGRIVWIAAEVMNGADSNPYHVNFGFSWQAIDASGLKINGTIHWNHPQMTMDYTGDVDIMTTETLVFADSLGRFQYGIACDSYDMTFHIDPDKPVEWTDPDVPNPWHTLDYVEITLHADETTEYRIQDFGDSFNRSHNDDREVFAVRLKALMSEIKLFSDIKKTGKITLYHPK